MAGAMVSVHAVSNFQEQQRSYIRNRILDAQKRPAFRVSSMSRSLVSSVIREPLYHTNPALLNSNKPVEVEFYLNCHLGHELLAQRAAETKKFTLPVYQFGLELASFGGHHNLVKWLLQRTKQLHSGMFEQAVLVDNQNPDGPRWRLIFDLAYHLDMADLLNVYLEFGWRPSQLWESPTRGVTSALKCAGCVARHKQVTLRLLVLEQGLCRPDWQMVLCEAFEAAIESWDTQYLEQIRSFGADVTTSFGLFAMVNPSPFASPALRKPFDNRATMAYYLLNVGVDINRIWHYTMDQFQRAAMEWAGVRALSSDHTVLSLAYAAEDWPMVSLLVRRGANIHSLHDKALKPQTKWIGYDDGQYPGSNN